MTHFPTEFGPYIASYMAKGEEIAADELRSICMLHGANLPTTLLMELASLACRLDTLRDEAVASATDTFGRARSHGEVGHA